MNTYSAVELSMNTRKSDRKRASMGSFCLSESITVTIARLAETYMCFIICHVGKCYGWPIYLSIFQSVPVYLRFRSQVGRGNEVKLLVCSGLQEFNKAHRIKQLTNLYKA